MEDVFLSTADYVITHKTQVKDDIVIKFICSGKLATNLAILAAACCVMHLPPASSQHILVAPYIHHHDHGENLLYFSLVMYILV